LVFAKCVLSEWFLFVEYSCMSYTVCRRDEDFEHVTLGDSDSELESGQFSEFEKVVLFLICTAPVVSRNRTFVIYLWSAI